jgi:hypothetical protein
MLKSRRMSRAGNVAQMGGEEEKPEGKRPPLMGG